jgi:hypothetical protein
MTHRHRPGLGIPTLIQPTGGRRVCTQTMSRGPVAASGNRSRCRVGGHHAWPMLVVQRVRIRWSPVGRGAVAATRRRAVPTTLPLPDAPEADLVVHDVHAHEADDYQFSARLLTGEDAAAALALHLQPGDTGSVAVRRQPFWVAHPHGRLSHGRRLFVLSPAQVGRYQLNFRTRHTQCQCAATWFYEHWVVHVANAPASRDLFLATTPTYTIDELTHLYGGRETTRRDRR